MSTPEFTVGDEGVHYLDVMRIATVTSVQRRRWIFRNWVYLVQWEPGSPSVPMPAGTWRAPSSCANGPGLPGRG